jgi:hypothetical protein
VNNLGQSLEDRLVRWDEHRPTGRSETLLVDPAAPTGTSTEQEPATGRTPVDPLSPRYLSPEERAQAAAAAKLTEAQARLTDAQTAKIRDEVWRAAQVAESALNLLSAKLVDLTKGQVLDKQRLEQDAKIAAEQFKVANATLQQKISEFTALAGQRKADLAYVNATVSKILLDNKLTQLELTTLRLRADALTATVIASEDQNRDIISLRTQIAAMEKRKGKKGTLETITLPIADQEDEAARGEIPQTMQQRVTWTEFDEQELAAAYSALQVLTGQTIDRGGGNRFQQTAGEIAAENERDRSLQRELRRAEITAEIMMSQSSQQLQVAVANGQMTTEAALTVYEQRNANARTYVAMEMDRAELQYADLASTRVYAANLISSEMDLTKWLLERRVPEEREWLREPGTPVGGVAGQPLDPVRIDPREVAIRVAKEVGIDEKTEEAKQAAMRAVVEAEQRLGSAQEAAPPVSEIAVPDQASPAATAASLVPTGAS